jgi:4-amino-4-deoxychorismate lyase
MSQFIESIAYKNGKLHNIDLHNKRLNQTRQKFFNSNKLLAIENEIDLPKEWEKDTLYKCRMGYSEWIDSVDFIKYEPKIIKSIELIFDQNIAYKYKYENRNLFNHYLQKSNEDEIIIIKNNLVTDSSYSNLIFFDGKQWVTPKTFLLNGTQRQYLIKKNLILEKEIRWENIKNYSHFKLINALLTPENSPILSTSIIKK